MIHETIELVVPGADGGAPLTAYAPDNFPALGMDRRRPALIICPGGGYHWCSPREKDAPAAEFLSLGYQVFILDYTCYPQDMSNFRSLRELGEAVRLVRKNHRQWHIDPEKVAVLGFSAGGHLAASLGAFWNDSAVGLPDGARPDALVLCYPVISTREFAHEGSAQNISGGDEAYRDKLNLLQRVTPDFPPTFLWHGGQDDCVPPENSLLLAVELRKHAVPFEYHLFGSGAHGISTCTQEVETPDEACRPWLALCKAWLNRRFQFTP